MAEMASAWFSKNVFQVASAGSGVANHAEKSESARVGDRRDEFGAGDASHAGQDDGVPAVKQVTHPRGQMTPQVPRLLCSGLRLRVPAAQRWAHSCRTLSRRMKNYPDLEEPFHTGSHLIAGTKTRPQGIG